MQAYQPRADYWDAADIKARAPRRRFRLRLFVPLTLIALVLAPFALLLALLCAPFGRVTRVDSLAAAIAIGRLLFSLSGSDVLVDTPDTLIHIRIF